MTASTALADRSSTYLASIGDIAVLTCPGYILGIHRRYLLAIHRRYAWHQQPWPSGTNLIVDMAGFIFTGQFHKKYGWPQQPWPIPLSLT